MLLCANGIVTGFFLMSGQIRFVDEQPLAKVAVKFVAFLGILVNDDGRWRRRHLERWHVLLLGRTLDQFVFYIA